MLKKVTVLTLVVLLMATFVSYAFAATTSNTSDKYVELQKQMLELRKQVIDEWVANGDITAEQGKLMKENIDLRIKALEDGTFTPGFGRGFRGGWGRGGCGFGGGFGGCWGAGATGASLY